ncbi:MAG: hypothetical protein AB7N80_04180 [Bdellovibrionales bacterium]
MAFADIDELLENSDLRIVDGRPTVVFNKQYYQSTPTPKDGRLQAWSSNRNYALETRLEQKSATEVSEIERDTRTRQMGNPRAPTPVRSTTFEISKGEVKSATGCEMLKTQTSIIDQRQQDPSLDRQNLECWTVTAQDCKAFQDAKLPLSNLNTPESIVEIALVKTCQSIAKEMAVAQNMVFSSLNKNKESTQQKSGSATARRLYETYLSSGKAQVTYQDLKTPSVAEMVNNLAGVRLYAHVALACDKMRSYKLPPPAAAPKQSAPQEDRRKGFSI